MFKPDLVNIEIFLDTPQQTEGLYLLSAFSQWKPDPRFAFQWTPQGYRLQFEMLQGNLLECRVSLDLHEETGPEGLKRDPRVIVADQDQTLRFEVLGFRASLDPEASRTGHIEEHQIFSPEFQEEVKLLVYLPPQYFEQHRARFPVVYLHDGHNVFDRATSSYGFEWQADETAEHFARDGHPVVLVAIWTPPEKRMQLYVPFPSRIHGFQPLGMEYLSFIVQTLKPWVDQHFRVHRERSHTGICGSSLGGIISLYGALHHPEVFGVAGVMSPALWVGEYRALEEAAQSSAQVRYFVDMGEREGPTIEGAANMVRLARMLALTLAQQGSEVELVIGENHLHHESAWAKRFPLFLKFFLGVP